MRICSTYKHQTIQYNSYLYCESFLKTVCLYIIDIKKYIIIDYYQLGKFSRSNIHRLTFLPNSTALPYLKSTVRIKHSLNDVTEGFSFQRNIRGTL